MLSSHFVGLRKEVQQIERDNDERSSIPITVRYVDVSSPDQGLAQAELSSKPTRSHRPNL